jgi:hypothetical protein
LSLLPKVQHLAKLLGDKTKRRKLNEILYYFT